VTDNAIAPTQHFDVLIVGAGLSGVGAACRLLTRTRGTRYAILEARDVIGGTWDLFRYPGVRSDSDVFTLGYPFRPWRGSDAIRDGTAILAYIREAAAAYGVDRHIRFGHRVVAASWSSSQACWTVTALAEPGARTVSYTCWFLYLCTGYYDYRRGYEVDFPGSEEFAGDLVHPQRWPAELDYCGRRVVVIGSGATAITLVPALAAEAEHVTMVQRSPTYVVSRPARDRFVRAVQAILPAMLAHRVSRGKYVLLTVAGYQALRRWPQGSARLLRSGVARQLPASVPVDPHFTPAYDPWDQRLCLAADGDLFRVLRDGRASVVTDRVDTLTAKGVRLVSGEHLEADIVVTATGLNMVAFGRIALTVDGRAVDPASTIVYQGMMFSGVPNLVWCVGYPNNSWTLRADLTALRLCRLLNHMRHLGYAMCAPYAGEAGAAAGSDAEPTRPLLDLTSGYVRRAADKLPRQGARRPWRIRTNYLTDLVTLRLGRISSSALRFGASARRRVR
jgi:monooxygenase